MKDVIAFVQFMHPGIECTPKRNADIIPWNRGGHKRKFLCNPGWYMNNGQQVHDELTFWGEWEPQSRITRINNSIGEGYPHFIHHPMLDLSEPKRTQKGCRQNTDPFVFHEQFLYRCCHQITRGRQTQLAHLLPGSIVLFGSCVNELFAIDTVFVVGDEFRNYYDQKGGMDFDPNLENYAKIVGIGLKNSKSGNCSGCGSSSGCGNKHTQMRLYYGASPDNNYHGMYSFVPCKRLSDNEQGWARPTLTRDDMRNIYADTISDRLKQNYKLCKGATLEGNVKAWNHIRKLFEEKGYLEGVRFECPQNGDVQTNR